MLLIDETSFDLQQMDKKFVSLHNKISVLETVQHNFILPVNKAVNLIGEIEAFKKFVWGLESKKAIDELIKKDLLCKIDSVLDAIKVRASKNGISYQSKLNELGVTKGGVEKICNKFLKIDVQRIAEEYFIMGSNYEIKPIENEKDAINVKMVCKKMLKKMYMQHPIRKNLGSFDSILKRVDYNGTSSSYCTPEGSISFGLGGLEVLRNKKDGLNQINILGVVSLLGEEAIFGHQLNYFIKKIEHYPAFISANICPTLIHMETQGKLGELMVKDIFKKEEILEEFIKKFGNNSMDYLGLDKKIREIKTFCSLYGDYLFYIKKIPVSGISEELYDYTGDPYYKSENYKKLASRYFETSYGDILKRSTDWAYFFAEPLADRVYDLVKKNKSLQQKVMQNFYGLYLSYGVLSEYIDLLHHSNF